MMEMEADRMRDLSLDDRDIATELRVVQEERNQRIESDPGALFSEQRDAAQYLNHPYGRPVIGWMDEVEALELADALAFYETYYAPNNAILIVAGDVDPDEVRDLAEEHYGPLEPTEALPERVRPQEPPQLAERRLTFEDARVAQPYLVRTYLAPERDPGAQEEAAALTLLAEILGGGQTSELATRLQFGTGEALYTSAFYSGTVARRHDLRSRRRAGAGHFAGGGGGRAGPRDRRASSRRASIQSSWSASRPGSAPTRSIPRTACARSPTVTAGR